EAKETESAAVPEAEPGPSRVESDLVLRVRSAAIDQVMAALGDARVIAGQLSEIVIEDRRKADALAGLQRLRASLSAQEAAELQRHLETLREREGDLAQLDGKLAAALSQLHGDALDLRVVPIDTVLSRLPRTARELAESQGKRVHVRIEGRDARIDKS